MTWWEFAAAWLAAGAVSVSFVLLRVEAQGLEEWPMRDRIPTLLLGPIVLLLWLLFFVLDVFKSENE